MSETGTAPSVTEQADPSLAMLARDAFVWGLPLVLFDRWMQIGLDDGVPYNQFRMNGTLSAPGPNSTPGLNVDTIYGFVYVDLREGPLIIGVPDTDDRYYSLQIQDAYLNTIAYIGRRMTGTDAGHFALTPPGWEGVLPDGVRRIEATTTRLFILARIFVNDPADLDGVRKLLLSFTSGAVSQFPDGLVNAEFAQDITKYFPYVEVDGDSRRFYEDLDRLVRMHPPLDWDLPNLERFAPLGIGTSKPANPDADMDAILATASVEGFRIVKSGLAFTKPNGWMRRNNVPGMYRDPVQRAANNYFQYATLVAEEGMYFASRQGGVGDFLDGANRYRISFAPDQLPPVDAFWSLTLYDKGYLLFGNPLNRYAILDRTDGLRFGPDGDLVIQIQADEPEEGSSNWLPSPRGEFQLVIRCYQPRQQIVDGAWAPPAAKQVGTA